MQQGLPSHEDQARVYAEAPNSQVVGSCVYVYTTGNAPMRMVWSFPDISYGPDQNVKKYIEVDCFLMELCNGYLTIVDSLDDDNMCHGVRFEKMTLEYIVEKDDDDDRKPAAKPRGDDLITDFRHRRAVIIRRMENVQSNFVDSSRIKLNTAMREALSKSRANNCTDGYPGRKAL
jgi:hypothetical protein